MTCIAQFNSLLEEAEDAKVHCNPIVFKEFFLRKKKEKLDENVVRRFHKKLYKYQPVSDDKLQEMQLKAVIKALNMGIFDFVDDMPSLQAVKRVIPELTSEHLPCNFELTDQFKMRYAIFRQFADKRGPMLVFNYEIYGQYVLENFHRFSEEQIDAVFELDVKLKLLIMLMICRRCQKRICGLMLIVLLIA